MPELSRFYGIIIYMFIKDHNPPHFHAKYGEAKCMINIQSGEVLEGELPNKSLRLIRKWLKLHRQELLWNWESAQSDNPDIRKIPPLP